jgi:hypothetical protein
MKKGHAIHLTCIIPGLARSIRAVGNGVIFQTDSVLETFLNPKNKMTAESIIEKTILRVLTGVVDNSIPYSAICALGEGFLVQPRDWWLRIDPVELHVDGAQIYLLGNQHLELTLEETQRLMLEINPFLVADNLNILGGSSPMNWYLRLDHAPEVGTYCLSEVIGQDIRPYLPFGLRQQQWRKLMTEIQMLLSQSSVNQQRMQQCRPMVNSVWFWGEGRLPVSYSMRPWERLWGAHSLIRGLAKLNNSRVNLSSATHFQMCMDEIQKPGEYFVIVDDLATKNLGQGIQSIKKHWLQPMLDALRVKAITQISFYPDDGYGYVLSSKELVSWWHNWWTKGKRLNIQLS